MDLWQKSYIEENLDSLIKQTRLTKEMEDILLAEKVLTDVDLKELEYLRESKGNSAAEKLLFHFLVARQDSYLAIGRAAFETKQSGPFLILLKGLVQHLLQQSEIDLEEETLNDILRAEHDKENTLKFFASKIDKKTLFEDNWIPLPQNDVYIPRHISNRVTLNPNIFKQKSSDIFVFTGLTRLELTKLIHAPTTLSSRVIAEKKKTSRFILLEHEKDWDKLTTLYSEPAHMRSQKDNKLRPVHLIAYDASSDECILQNSTSPSELFSRHAATPHMKKQSLHVSEDQFLIQINDPNHQNAICICDTPGMGRTRLLQNLARDTKILKPRRVIAVISLSEFVRDVYLSAETSQMEFSKAVQVLLRYLCPFSLTAAVMEKCLQSNRVELDLFLDGIDEIPKKRLESTKHFFRTFVTSKIIRMIVTSSPHMRQELIEVFGAVAYDVLPFSEETQVDYLVRFWQRLNDCDVAGNEEKLRECAVASLQNLKKSVTKEESYLMGVPLQCFLLATVYAKNAQIYCHQDNPCNADELLNVTSMYLMYYRYVEMGIDKGIVKCEKYNEDPKIPHALKAFHVWKALQLLYPQLAEDYFKSESLSEREPSNQVWACGLLQTCTASRGGNKAVTFLHRTFAEYLVAEFFADVVTGQQRKLKEKKLHKIMEVFVQSVLHADTCVNYRDTLFKNYLNLRYVQFRQSSFTLGVMAYFLNANLERRQLDSYPAVVAKSFSSLMTGTTLSQILSASITSSHVNIIRLLKHFLCQTFTSQDGCGKEELRELLTHEARLEEYPGSLPNKHYLSCCAYLCLAAATSTVTVVNELYNLYQECLGENLDDICLDMPTDFITPLHHAVVRREYDLVEFFLVRISVHQRDLLYHCVQDIQFCSSDEVRIATDICNLLIQKGSNIFQDENLNVRWLHDFRSPFLAVGVHVELVKFFLLQGADIQANTSDHGNVLTWYAYSMRQSHFGELCRFLVCDKKYFDYFNCKLHKWDNPIPHIIKIIDDITLKQILRIPGICLDSVDSDGNNLILATIMANGHVGVVRKLIKCGIDPHKKSDNGKGALHLAAYTGNVGMAKFLVSAGLPLEETDKWGNRPLHYAAEHVDNIDMMKYLISQHVNIFAVNRQGNNIAHIAAKNGWSDDFVEYLVTLENVQRLLGKRNSSWKTPLQLLFSKGFPLNKNIELVLGLPGVEVQVENEDGENAFLMAVKGGQNVKMLQLLIEKGSCPYIVNRWGKTALHLAVKGGDVDVINYLVSLGLSWAH